MDTIQICGRLHAPKLEFEMFVVMCSNGLISLDEVQEDCRANQWFPILTYVLDSQKIVPVFSDAKVARQFIKRNLPKTWLHGAIELFESDVITLKKKYQIREMKYPNLMKDLPGIEWKEEILELDSKPDFMIRKL